MSKKGTYIVLLKSEQSKNIQIGKLAPLEIRKGYYIYIGSALGPGGVLARLKHHSKISRKPHWHLDYLRAETEFYRAYALLSLDRKECEWSVFMAQLEEVSEPMEGFGSSDCNCNTHLFYCSSMVKAVRAIGKISQARKVAADRLI